MMEIDDKNRCNVSRFADSVGGFADPLSGCADSVGGCADLVGMAQRLYDEGRRHWREGRRGEAMSAYAKAADIDPNSPAVQALEMAQAVMNFYNPDQFNP